MKQQNFVAAAAVAIAAIITFITGIIFTNVTE